MCLRRDSGGLALCASSGTGHPLVWLFGAGSSVSRFFVRREGSVRGPISLRKLQQLLADKKLKPTDLVRNGDEGPWHEMADVHKQIRAGEWPDYAQGRHDEPDDLSVADADEAVYDEFEDDAYGYEDEDGYDYDPEVEGDPEEFELAPRRKKKKKSKPASKAQVRKDTGSDNSTRILIIAAVGVLLILIAIGVVIGIGAGGSGTSEAEAELWAEYKKFQEEDNTEMRLSVLRRLEELNPNAKSPDGTTVTKLRTLVEQTKQEEEFTEDFMRRLGR